MEREEIEETERASGHNTLLTPAKERGKERTVGGKRLRMQSSSKSLSKANGESSSQSN